MSAQFHSTMTGLGALGEAALIFLVGSLPVLFLLAILCLVVFGLLYKPLKKYFLGADIR